MDAHRHLARYECVIPLHRCSHAEKKKSREAGRRPGNLPSSFTSGGGFNDYAGSAEVEHSLGPDQLPAEHREHKTDGFKETRKSSMHCTGDGVISAKYGDWRIFFPPWHLSVLIFFFFVLNQCQSSLLLHAEAQRLRCARRHV